MRSSTQAVREILQLACAAGAVPTGHQVPVVAGHSHVHVLGCAEPGREGESPPPAQRTLEWLLARTDWCAVCLTSPEHLGVRLAPGDEETLDLIRWAQGGESPPAPTNAHRQLLRVSVRPRYPASEAVRRYYRTFLDSIPARLRELRETGPYREQLLRYCLQGLRFAQGAPAPQTASGTHQGVLEAEVLARLPHPLHIAALDGGLYDTLTPGQEQLLDQLCSVPAWVRAGTSLAASPLYTYALEVSESEPRAVRLPALALVAAVNLEDWAGHTNGDPPWFAVGNDVRVDDFVTAAALTAAPAAGDPTPRWPQDLDPYLRAVVAARGTD